VPLDLIAWLALATVAVSFAALVAELVLHFTDPNVAPKGFTTLIVGMLFIGGIQLLCLAIIGSYVAHIYEESKHRPPYLVESILNAPGHARSRNGAMPTETGAPERERIRQT
jgi:polyisoprenyl-phosphate glycosyltransferase